MGIAEADVVPHRDDPLFVDVAHDADQRALVGPVRLHERAHEAVAGEGEAVEAQESAPERQVAEEVDEGRDVVVGRWP